jgi:small subunit ribosomal protein S4e
MPRHLKRLRAPAFWKVAKKEAKWVVRPLPGPHPLEKCIPLLVIVRDILKLAENAKEGRKIIKKGEILVDCKVRKDHKFPVGLFDSISIPKMGKNYRIIPTKKGLELIEIGKREASKKICKIVRKVMVKGSKVQLTLHDGKNILVDDAKKYLTGDSLLIKLPTLEILNHIQMKKGRIGIAIGGKNMGEIARIIEIKEGKMREPPKILCSIGKRKITILEEHFFLLGEKEPLIKVK